MADSGELGKALELCVSSAGDLRADKRELLQIFQASELRHASIAELAIVGEAQGLQAGELSDAWHPRIVKLRGDNVKRFQRGDVTQMLEESSIIGIYFTMIMRPCTWHGKIDKLQAFTIFGLLDFTFCTFDRTNNGFNMGIESKTVGRGKRK